MKTNPELGRLIRSADRGGLLELHDEEPPEELADYCYQHGRRNARGHWILNKLEYIAIMKYGGDVMSAAIGETVLPQAKGYRSPFPWEKS
jgi:hypothetical protein